MFKTYADWPKKGVYFRDMSPLFKNPELFKEQLNNMLELIKDCNSGVDLDFDYIAGPEARGFIIAAGLSITLQPKYFAIL